MVTSSTSSSKRVFSKTDERLIRNIYQDMIKGHVTIRKAEVIKRIKDNALDLLKRCTSMQLLLKVRTEKRAHDRRNCP